MSKQVLVNNDLLTMRKLADASACAFASATIASKSYIVSEEQANALYTLACEFTAHKAEVLRELESKRLHYQDVFESLLS